MSDTATTMERDPVAQMGVQSEGEYTETKKERRIFTSYLFRNQSNSNVVFSQEPPSPPPTFGAVRRPARVARMLALAHHLQQAIDNGEIQDRAALARKFGLTRARITHLLNLTLLAPDIQEQVLTLEAVDGLEPTSERALRDVSCAVEWEEQRRRWGDVCLSTDRLVLRKIGGRF
jgi:hypothetical protein